MSSKNVRTPASSSSVVFARQSFKSISCTSYAITTIRAQQRNRKVVEDRTKEWIRNVVLCWNLLKQFVDNLQYIFLDTSLKSYKFFSSVQTCLVVLWEDWFVGDVAYDFGQRCINVKCKNWSSMTGDFFQAFDAQMTALIDTIFISSPPRRRSSV